jgi:hypothetical protein
MSICRTLLQGVLSLSACALLLQTEARAYVTIDITAAMLTDSSGNPMPVPRLVILVASTNDSHFSAPTATSFVSGDDIIVKKWDLSAEDTAGVLFDTTGPLSLTGNWGVGDPLAIYWFPTLTIDATEPGTAAPYGFYRDSTPNGAPGSGLDGSNPWFTPAEGSIALKFLTTDVDGSNPPSAGRASYTTDAAKLAFTTQPATTGAGDTMASFVVQIQDAFGNSVANSGVNITLTPSSGAIYSGTNPQVTDGTGKATFNDIVIRTGASGLTFTAAAPPLTSATSTAFDITPQCSAGDISKSWGITNGNIHIVIEDSYGLGSVKGLRYNNCNVTNTAYGAGGAVLESGVSLTQDSSHSLPVGTIKVLCVATKVNPALGGSCNAEAFNLCGSFSGMIDPVTVLLTLANSGETLQTFTGILAAERFVSLHNGTPGLTQLTLKVNGHLFVLDPLSDGVTKSLDVGAAMNPGDANTVVLVGKGPAGASAVITIADAAMGDPVIAAESMALQIAYSAGGVQLSWPDQGAGYVLQSRSSTAPSNTWVNWPDAPQSVKGRFTLTAPAGGAARFFRLYKP